MIAHLALAFVIGGAFVAACTFAAERFGPRIGGIVAGLPSTAGVTLAVVALTESPAAAVQETTFIPVVLGLNCLFFAAYGRLARRGALPALAGALAVWLCLAALAVVFDRRDLTVSLLLQALGFGIGLALLRDIDAPPAVGSAPHSSIVQLLGRAVFGGTVIAIGVWLARAGGPYVGGIAAAFPAAGVSTLAIVAQARGVAFATGLLKPMLTSGAISILAYALVVRYTYESIGVAGGTALALVAACTCAALLVAIRQAHSREDTN